MSIKLEKPPIEFEEFKENLTSMCTQTQTESLKGKNMLLEASEDCLAMINYPVMQSFLNAVNKALKEKQTNE